MKIIKAIKQFKQVVELQEENELLYDEKVYYQTELYETTKKRCQQYYKIFNAIKEIVNENQNGSVINMQNRIKTKLKEFKL